MVDEVSGSAGTAAASGGSRQVSQLSRIRAANGDTTTSAETQQAIANGALPPTVASSGSSRNEAVVQDISEEGQQLAETGTIENVGGGLDAAAEAIVIPDAGVSLNISV